MKKSFKSLELNKKTIAKLKNNQLSSVKGGKVVLECKDGGISIATSLYTNDK